MALSCRKSLVLRLKIGGKTRRVEVGAEDCTLVAGELRACSMYDCDDVLCFEDFGEETGRG